MKRNKEKRNKEKRKEPNEDEENLTETKRNKRRRKEKKKRKQTKEERNEEKRWDGRFALEGQFFWRHGHSLIQMSDDKRNETRQPTRKKSEKIV